MKWVCSWFFFNQHKIFHPFLPSFLPHHILAIDFLVINTCFHVFAFLYFQSSYVTLFQMFSLSKHISAFVDPYWYLLC